LRILNTANVAKITIGFGDEGVQAANNGVVYFDNIRLYQEYPAQQQQHKVVYNGSSNNLRGGWWHVWNIELAEFNDVNLANIKRITIGFGDGSQAESDGTVYFDDIILRYGKAEAPPNPINEFPVYLDEDPFVNGYRCYPYFLKQDCPLIDAGYRYIEQSPYIIGKATDVNWAPDSNVADIGFHFINWSYVNAGRSPADLDDSNTVDFRDFAILADGWQASYDINDLKIMADEWLKAAEPNIQLQIAGDGNNGFVEFGADGFLPDTQRIFLLADGQYVGEIFGFREGYPFGMDVSEFGGGGHLLKTISVNNDCHITCSNITDTAFTCPLNYCMLPESYEPNKPLYFSAFNPSDGNVSINVYADCGNLVWSQDYNGVSFFNSIPAEITGRHEIDYIIFNKSGVGAIMKIPDPAEPGPRSGDIKALIILHPDFYRINIRQVMAVQKAFDDRGIKKKRLIGDATYDNISLYVFYNPIKYIYVGTHGNYHLGGF